MTDFQLLEPDTKKRGEDDVFSYRSLSTENHSEFNTNIVIYVHSRHASLKALTCPFIGF